MQVTSPVGTPTSMGSIVPGEGLPLTTFRHNEVVAIREISERMFGREGISAEILEMPYRSNGHAFRVDVNHSQEAVQLLKGVAQHSVSPRDLRNEITLRLEEGEAFRKKIEEEIDQQQELISKVATQASINKWKQLQQQSSSSAGRVNALSTKTALWLNAAEAKLKEEQSVSLDSRTLLRLRALGMLPETDLAEKANLRVQGQLNQLQEAVNKLFSGKGELEIWGKRLSLTLLVRQLGYLKTRLSLASQALVDIRDEALQAGDGTALEALKERHDRQKKSLDALLNECKEQREKVTEFTDDSLKKFVLLPAEFATAAGDEPHLTAESVVKLLEKCEDVSTKDAKVCLASLALRPLMLKEQELATVREEIGELTKKVAQANRGETEVHEGSYETLRSRLLGLKLQKKQEGVGKTTDVPVAENETLNVVQQMDKLGAADRMAWAETEKCLLTLRSRELGILEEEIRQEESKATKITSSIAQANNEEDIKQLHAQLDERKTALGELLKGYEDALQTVSTLMKQYPTLQDFAMKLGQSEELQTAAQAKANLAAAKSSAEAKLESISQAITARDSVLYPKKYSYLPNTLADWYYQKPATEEPAAASKTA